MQLSQTVEYALRAVVWLAQHPGSPQTTQQIADATRMPSSYLSKVLQGLARADVVSGRRGLHGGFTLDRPAADLTLLEVVNAVEPVQRIRTCPLEIEGHGSELCALHRTLDDIMAATEASLAAKTIGMLLEEPNRSTPLCDPTPEHAAPTAVTTARSDSVKR